MALHIYEQTYRNLWTNILYRNLWIFFGHLSINFGMFVRYGEPMYILFQALTKLIQEVWKILRAAAIKLLDVMVAVLFVVLDEVVEGSLQYECHEQPVNLGIDVIFAYQALKCNEFLVSKKQTVRFLHYPHGKG